ncbi:hypothetical protein HPO96_37075 [Kribbella sandramycini]|uniref:Uncharacterized protein n=1 Tax=Kribbella sandramycini TaxID=60450 RepID=A0A7Y4P486_9ACTN|nr:hypothetical protein [Kribbella sandramycini]MBB6564412.1 hypothetical protein [Kribbella sandramycini]NOL45873.1 hypothetical protein [Kribbella sandramycini]
MPYVKLETTAVSGLSGEAVINVEFTSGHEVDGMAALNAAYAEARRRIEAGNG